MNDIYEIVAQRIAELRAIRDWSQERLAEEAGIGASYVARIETGQRKPTLKTLDRIARALDVPLAQLLAPSATSVSPSSPELLGLGPVLRQLSLSDVNLVYRFAERLAEYGPARPRKKRSV